MQRFACKAALGLILALGGASLAAAASLPTATEGDWVAPQFNFHNGEQLANLKLHYITLGNPKLPAILYLARHLPAGQRSLEQGLWR